MKKERKNFESEAHIIKYRPSEKALRYFSGLYNSSFRGRGLEFDDLRSFDFGDDPKNISWAKFAQTKTLYTKIFQEERELVVYIVIDPSSSMSWARTVKAECVIQIVELISRSALINRDRVGISTGSQASNILEFIPASLGNRSIQHADYLSEKVYKHLEINRKMKFHREEISLKESLFPFFHKHLKSSRALIFIISDFLATDNETKKMIEKLSYSSDLIPIRVLDIWDQSIIPLYEHAIGPYGPLCDQFDLMKAERLHKILLDQQEMMRDFFFKNGLDCIEISENESGFSGNMSPYKALELFFRKRILAMARGGGKR